MVSSKSTNQHESTNKPKFEIFKDKEDKYRFRLKAGNGEIIAASQGYTSKQSCKKGIEAVRQSASIAEVYEVEE